MANRKNSITPGTPAPAPARNDANRPATPNAPESLIDAPCAIAITPADIEAAAAKAYKPCVHDGVKYTTFATDGRLQCAPVGVCKLQVTFAVAQDAPAVIRLCNAFTAAKGGRLKGFKPATIASAIVRLVCKGGANVLYAKASELTFSAELKDGSAESKAVAAACKARAEAATACAVADDAMRAMEREQCKQSAKQYSDDALIAMMEARGFVVAHK